MCVEQEECRTLCGQNAAQRVIVRADHVERNRNEGGNTDDGI